MIQTDPEIPTKYAQTPGDEIAPDTAPMGPPSDTSSLKREHHTAIAATSTGQRSFQGRACSKA